MPDTKRQDRIIALGGGILADSVGPGDGTTYLENLVPPASSNVGLDPREGIEWLYTLPIVEGRANNTCCVYLVTLDDVTRQKLVVVQDPNTKEILHLTKYSEQAGVSAMPPYGCGHASLDDPGGEGCHLPVTPTPAPEFGNLLYFEHSSVGVIAGDVATLTVKGVNQGGTASWSTEDDTGVAGTDYTATSGTVTASDSSDGTVSVQTAVGGLGKAFQVYLYQPQSGALLKNPSMCEVNIVSIGIAPVAYRFEESEDQTKSNAKVLFYDIDANSMVGPATLEEVSTGDPDGDFHNDSNYVLARGENCLFTRGSSVDGDIYLQVWDLADITDPTASYPYSRRIKVCDGSTLEPRVLFDVRVFSYAGNKAYVIIQQNLYLVDLGTGDVTTVAAPITGIDDGYAQQFASNLFGTDAVDSAGNLWTQYGSYNESVTYHTVVINPLTGAVIQNEVLTNEDDGTINVTGFSALADGEMYWPGTHDGSTFKKVSASVVASDLSISTDYYGGPFLNSCPNCVVGTKTLLLRFSDGAISTVDVVSGSEIGSTPPITGGAYFCPPSVLSATSMMAFSSASVDDGYQYFIQIIDLATGSELLNATSDVLADSGFLPFADVFAYGIKHIQGDAN